MGKKDPRIDAYIAKSAEFARPILNHLRKIVHEACPDVEETVKWSMPFFVHKGSVCHMAAFKQHAAFGFWMSELVVGRTADSGAMGHFGRITSIADLPPDETLASYVRKAVELNDAGTKAPWRVRAKPGQARPVAVPDDFALALKKSRKAHENFEKFSPSHKREYVEWVTSAKREETRQKRLAQAVAQIAEGKSRNWRYERC